MTKKMRVYCRKCGGTRNHLVHARVNRPWHEYDQRIQGGDDWIIVECAGCDSVSFVHEHWFSEDIDEDGDPITRHNIYPPSPDRKMMEWGTDLFTGLQLDELWIQDLYSSIYAAAGIRAYALSAMGARTIVDYIVTSKSGIVGKFEDKLKSLHSKNIISEAQIDVLGAAFDAGSAASHRGYQPTKQDLYILLDIMESLIRQIFVDPVEKRRHAKAAETLRRKTPQRHRKGQEQQPS